MKQERSIIGYCENQEKIINPYHLHYFGSEKSQEALSYLKKSDYFIAVGNNQIREKIQKYLIDKRLFPCLNAIHPSSIIANSINLGKGILIAANATINPLAKIGNGVICNTACIIEHECQIGDFAHIAPGAVLAGNVIIGERTFVGANSVIKQGIAVGKNVTIGAGSVIIKNIPNGATVVGNPGKIIKI